MQATEPGTGVAGRHGAACSTPQPRQAQERGTSGHIPGRASHPKAGRPHEAAVHTLPGCAVLAEGKDSAWLKHHLVSVSYGGGGAGVCNPIHPINPDGKCIVCSWHFESLFAVTNRGMQATSSATHTPRCRRICVLYISTLQSLLRFSTLVPLALQANATGLWGGVPVVGQRVVGLLCGLLPHKFWDALNSTSDHTRAVAAHSELLTGLLASDYGLVSAPQVAGGYVGSVCGRATALTPVPSIHSRPALLQEL
jgi:hypothetical protein